MHGKIPRREPEICAEPRDRPDTRKSATFSVAGGVVEDVPRELIGALLQTCHRLPSAFRALGSGVVTNPGIPAARRECGSSPQARKRFVFTPVPSFA